MGALVNADATRWAPAMPSSKPQRLDGLANARASPDSRPWGAGRHAPAPEVVEWRIETSRNILGAIEASAAGRNDSPCAKRDFDPPLARSPAIDALIARLAIDFDQRVGKLFLQQPVIKVPAAVFVAHDQNTLVVACFEHVGHAAPA